MRKIVLQLAVSLDGFIEGPKGEYDWCFTDQDYGMTEFFDRIDAVFVGRKSYEMSLSMEGEFPGMPKLQQYVFSETVDTVKEGSTLIRGDIKQKVLDIKSQEGKDIWLFGGASLTSSLINLGLVDELILAVHPIILGSGKHLFQDIENRVPLTLLNTKDYSSGLVMLTYKLA